MTTRRVGIIMNGVTGRMGTNQHLIRSIVAIRKQGGIALSGGDSIFPDPVLVGRDAKKLQALAETYGIERWNTNLEECLANPQDEIYFDALTTTLRAENLRKAIQA